MALSAFGATQDPFVPQPCAPPPPPVVYTGLLARRPPVRSRPQYEISDVILLLRLLGAKRLESHAGPICPPALPRRSPFPAEAPSKSPGLPVLHARRQPLPSRTRCEAAILTALLWPGDAGT
jgi:hypothetical protein